jgi:hypothetical protein
VVEFVLLGTGTVLHDISPQHFWYCYLGTISQCCVHASGQASYLCGHVDWVAAVADVEDGARHSTGIIALDHHIPLAVDDFHGVDAIDLHLVKRLVTIIPVRQGEQ